jgi:glycosyltransferase involved in cell wall biosynthesis
MLAILTTHPIQYQVPLWQRLTADGSVPFEVWYLSQQATELSRDREFGTEFAWDIDMLSGYRYRILKTPAGATPNIFWRSRITESLPKLFQETKTMVLWVNGWQVAAYWQAVWAAHKAGVKVWMRGESNSLREQRIQRSEVRGQRSEGNEGVTDERATRAPLHEGGLKQRAKRILLRQLFRRVDHFLCIGTANRELYRNYGIPESKLHMAMYAVDNERFRRQAEAIRGRRSVVRSQWSIPQESFCILFCGKFIPKKHPMDVVKAAQLLLASHPKLKVHLLFVGSGELGGELRAACHVVYDAEASQRSEVRGQRSAPDNRELITDNAKPAATFTGFLNQTEISQAYVAADVLVLPSDYGETWGLVVNEAMASGLTCLVSDRCGCAPDLGGLGGNAIFSFGNIHALLEKIVQVASRRDVNRAQPVELPSFSTTVDLAADLYA